ncbi:MAG: VWA domain-containing protein [bacterium]|nr:VWA domain-containing protein [bacterium]
MSFVTPMIFWIGLGTVAIPVIIHLLNRRRFRVREWAAMQFLLDSLRRNRRRLQIEELILMALRCLLLFLLAMMVARFTGCGDNDLIPGAGKIPETNIFILDDSFSMGQKVADSTLLENAIEDLTRQINDLSKNSKSDQIAILLTSKPSLDDAFQGLMPVADEEEIKQLITRLKKIKPSDLPAKLGQGLKIAGEMLSSEDEPKNVYIFSDFRTIDLGRGKPGRYQEAFKGLTDTNVRVVTLDYGRAVKSNLTVEKIEMLDKWALTGLKTNIAVTVRNNAKADSKNVPVALSARWSADGVDDRAAFPTKIIPLIPANSSIQIQFKVTLPKQGPAMITAKLPSDHLPGDNKGYLGLEVRNAVRVLIVDGHPDMTDPEMSESYRMSLLLDPKRNVSYGRKVTVIGTEGLEAQDLSNYDLVLLLDVPKLSDTLDADGKKVIYPQLLALEQYVRDGGGLAIFTGSNLNLTFYNGPMYAEGLGLSPLVISPPRGDPSAREKYRRLDARSISGDPFLRSLRGEVGAIRCGIVRFYAHTPCDPLTRSAASGDVKAPRVVAKFTSPDGDDGSPAIVVRQFGKGTVMMFYSTASTRWNDWADDIPESIYSTPMLDIMTHLAKSQSGLQTRRVGGSIIHTINRESRDARVTLKTPDDEITLEIITQDNKQIVKYDNPSYSGCYTMSLVMPDKSRRDLFFARNVDPNEGILTPGGKAMISRAMGSEDYKYVSRLSAGSVSDVAVKEQKEYWLPLLLGLLVLLAIETILAQRFGHYSGN